jgi:hypothetical protein
LSSQALHDYYFNLTQLYTPVIYQMLQAVVNNWNVQGAEIWEMGEPVEYTWLLSGSVPGQCEIFLGIKLDPNVDDLTKYTLSLVKRHNSNGSSADANQQEVVRRFAGNPASLQDALDYILNASPLTFSS